MNRPELTQTQPEPNSEWCQKSSVGFVGGAPSKELGASDVKYMNLNKLNQSNAEANDNISNLTSEANQSLRHSLYIAALDRYLGIRGLISPVQDTRGNLQYDFFHLQTGQLIKVFTTLDIAEMQRYRDNETELAPIFIIDTAYLDPDQLPDCGERETDMTSNDLVEATDLTDAYIYDQDCLWSLCLDWDEDELWKALMPIERGYCIDALYGMEHE